MHVNKTIHYDKITHKAIQVIANQNYNFLKNPKTNSDECQRYQQLAMAVSRLKSI